MRFPKIHTFLKWFILALAGGAVSCLGVFAAFAQAYPKVNKWGENLFNNWEPVMTAPWFAFLMVFLIAGYVGALVYTGGRPKPAQNTANNFNAGISNLGFTDGTPLAFAPLTPAQQEVSSREPIDFEQQLQDAQEALELAKVEVAELSEQSSKLENENQTYLAIENMQRSLQDIIVYQTPFAENLGNYETQIQKAERGEYSHGEGNEWMKSQCEMAAQYIPLLQDQFGINEIELPELENPHIETKASDDYTISPYQMMIEPSEIQFFIDAHRRNLTALKVQYNTLQAAIGERNRQVEQLRQQIKGLSQ